MYNKPEGEVTTREDPEGRPTIFEALPALKGARWIAIGRLDINTTGLLLLTTDGELANAMMHPSFEVEREYVCRVRPPEGLEVVPDNLADRLERGVALEDGPAKFDEIERIGGSDSHDWFRVLLKEGRNREVRRLWESQGCQVSRLKRIRYGRSSLPRELLRGQSQELAADKVDALRSELGLESGTPSALTLQPVIGQRKAAKSTIDLTGKKPVRKAYVSGHNTADEGRELRRFDNVREDRGRGRGGPRKHGGLTVSGETAAKQSQKPFKQRKEKGPRAVAGGQPRRIPYLVRARGRRYRPERSSQSRPARAVRQAIRRQAGWQARPGRRRWPGRRLRRTQRWRRFRQRSRRAGGPRRRSRFGGERSGGYGDRPPRREGGSAGCTAVRVAAGGGQGQGQGRAPKPYGHPGNAPSFPSDHANPGAFNPYGDKPRGPRPGGARRPAPRRSRPAGGPRPGGNRPGGPRPGGPRPGGPRPGGPRGGGRPGGGRHSGG